MTVEGQARSDSLAVSHPVAEFRQLVEIGKQDVELERIDIPTFSDPIAQSPVEDFQFFTVDEKVESSLSVLRGDYVLIDFWTPWCSDCERDTPRFQLLAKSLAKKQKTIILGIQAHGHGYTVRFPETMPANLKWINAELKYESSRMIRKRMGVWKSEHFVLVDPEGKFVAGGSLIQISKKLKELGLR